MAHKILLEGPGGRRWIVAGENFSFLPGEKLAIDENGKNIAVRDESEQELMVGLAKEGIQWGDAIARLTKVFGIQPCSKCEKRRKILNEAKKLGIKETLSKLKETI